MDAYKLGNLTVCSPEEIEARREEIGFIEESMPVDPECGVCRYYPLCRGGCKRYRNPRHYFCESFRRFFDYSLERLEKAAILYGKRMR